MTAHPFMSSPPIAWTSDPFLRCTFEWKEFKVFVPNDAMLDEIITSLASLKDLRTLIALSNTFVMNYGDYRNDPTTQKVIQHLSHNCEVSGIPKFMGEVALAAWLWYSRIETGRQGWDSLYRISLALHQLSEALIVHNPKDPHHRPIELDNLPQVEKQTSESLRKFSQFKEVDDFLLTIGAVAIADYYSDPTPEKQQVIMLASEAAKERGFSHFGKPSFLHRRSRCEYCNCFFTYDLSEGLGKHCSKEKCRKQHEAKLKREARQASAKTPQGWVKAFSSRICTRCKQKRVLNADRLCKECFLVACG